MKWNKFRLKTTTEAEDIVSSMLMDLGVQGIEIEDKIPMTQAEKEQMFVDILPETGINDGIAYISFYLEEDEDKESLLEAVKNELEDMRAYVEVGEGSASWQICLAFHISKKADIFRSREAQVDIGIV